MSLAIPKLAASKGRTQWTSASWMCPAFGRRLAQMMPLRKSIQMTGTTKTGLLYQGSGMRISSLRDDSASSIVLRSPRRRISSARIGRALQYFTSCAKDSGFQAGASDESSIDPGLIE